MTNKKLIPERWVVHHDNAGTTVKENKKWKYHKHKNVDRYLLEDTRDFSLNLKLLFLKKKLVAFMIRRELRF